MSRAERVWKQWRRFAHRAAQLQARIILGILYWVVVVPIGSIRRVRRAEPSLARWTPRRPAEPVSVEEARRQF
jgi:hypothetical protein